MLERTLRNLLNVDTPQNTQLQIIVVDNGSTDRTKNVIEQFATDLPIVSLEEKEQGHCFARNRAISAADGDLLIWTDDDVQPAPEWLECYVEAFHQHPECSFWGGPIIPSLDRTPDWIRENWEICKACFAERKLGENDIEFTKQMLPYGANFAVRTRVQRDFHFNTKLGRKGDEVVGDDEIEVMSRMIDGGHHGRWVPGASLRHLIPVERTTEKYVFDYFVGQGRQVAAKKKEPISSSGSLWKEAFLQRIFYLLKRRISPSKVWLTHLVRSALAKGKREWLTSNP